MLRNPFFRLFPWLISYSGNIPDLYWDIESDEQRYRWLCEWMYSIVYNLKANNDKDIVQDDRIQELFDIFEEFKESGFDDYYAAQVEKWIDSHLDFIYKYTLKQIYFALDDSGHLIAFIPESWQDINFWTPLDKDYPETYGHLQILLNNVIPYVEEVN